MERTENFLSIETLSVSTLPCGGNFIGKPTQALCRTKGGRCVAQFMVLDARLVFYWSQHLVGFFPDCHATARQWRQKDAPG